MWTSFKVLIEFVAVLLLFYVLVFLAVSHVGSELLTRDRTCTRSMGRQSLNYCTTREILVVFLK